MKHLTLSLCAFLSAISFAQEKKEAEVKPSLIEPDQKVVFQMPKKDRDPFFDAVDLEEIARIEAAKAKKFKTGCQAVVDAMVLTGMINSAATGEAKFFFKDMGVLKGGDSFVQTVDGKPVTFEVIGLIKGTSSIEFRCGDVTVIKEK